MLTVPDMYFGGMKRKQEENKAISISISKYHLCER
jgi:hypothetical protein